MMLLVMMMFVSPFGAWAQGNDPGNGSAVTSYGDVNEDGVVNILDVILVNQYLIGEKQLSDQGRINADVDNWKSRACLTPEGKAMLTPENFFILTPLKS